MVQVQDGDTILFIGDSITDVEFNRKQKHSIGGKDVYALQVARALQKKHKKLHFVYKGIASNRTYHVYDRLTADCMAQKPDVIVMLIGVNDAWENYVPEQYPPLLRPLEPHMKEILRRLQTELPAAKLVFLLPFLIDTMPEKAPFHTVLDEFRERLRTLVTGHAVEIIDLQAVFNEAQKTNDPKLLARDGVHPTDFGHSKIAEAVLQVLA